MMLLRSLFFYLGYYGYLIPHALLCIVSSPFLSIQSRYRYYLLWNAFTLWWFKITCGVKYDVSGKENIPNEVCVILANHQSPWETLFLYWEFRPVCAILKKELLNIPFFGWGLRLLNPIAIDRSKRNKSLQQLLDQGKNRLDEGISVLIFPEGTRVAPGVVKKFSAGGAELAIASGFPVIPVAHDAGHCWPAHKLVKHPGTVKVVIGKPINTSGRESRELIQEVEAWIRQAI